MDLSPEGRRIFGNLTVMENLVLATYARKDGEEAVARDLDRVLSLFPRLSERRRQRSESLSGGEQQMLAVGRAIMTGCDFILLDEPSMGLAPLLMYEMFRTLKKLNEQGLTVLLIEQNAKVALSFAHRGYVLDTGEIKTSGTAEELKNDPEVKKAYLGG
jgi:branched-chain amino acid transport system ATP-binding protein